MSRKIGTRLPDDLLQFFTVHPPHEEFKQVIQVTTLDEDGWPRHAMLSRWEVVARSNEILLMLLRSSRTALNVQSTGRVTLAVINPSMSYYVFCAATTRRPISEAPDALLFELATRSVVQDVLPTARIVSAIMFEGYDDGFDQETRAQAYRKLLTVDV
jgi:hypothetical protein